MPRPGVSRAISRERTNGKQGKCRHTKAGLRHYEEVISQFAVLLSRTAGTETESPLAWAAENGLLASGTERGKPLPVQEVNDGVKTLCQLLQTEPLSVSSGVNTVTRSICAIVLVELVQELDCGTLRETIYGVEEYRLTEISKLLGIEAETVKKRAQRGRKS